MSIIDVGAHSHAGTTLQSIAEQLSELLHRSVAVTTLDHTVRVVSERGTTHLRAALDIGATAESASCTTVEIRHDTELVGHLWVASGDLPPVSAAHYLAIDSAVSLAAGLIADRSVQGRSDHETVMSSLLSERVDDRRAAYGLALSRRWLQRGEGTVIRALMIDTVAGSVERLAFGRYLSTLRPIPLWVAGDRHGFLFVVGPPIDAATDRMIIDEGARRGIRILGVGTATAVKSADDLMQAADQAATAAELSATFTEFQPAVDIAELGGWVLLSAVTWDPTWLKVVSPAADALVTHGDETQRRTIETLLDVGGQVTAACELLFLHRTTLYYRLEKMPEVVREAMADGMKRSTLHLALKLVRLWESTGRI